MNRRHFIHATVISGVGSIVPGCIRAQESPSKFKIAKVPSGHDRLSEEHTIGVSHTTFKVLTGETAGNLFVMEQINSKKGGPPRHFHYNEEEFFYVMEGNYLAEIGQERFELAPGDCLLAPRKIPHVWAFVGNDKGRLLISFSPANKMEAWFRDQVQVRKPGTYTNPTNKEQVEQARQYGIEVVGPPLEV